MDLNANECNLLAQSGLSNHYGEVCLIECDGKHYMNLGNWGRDSAVMVSEEFAQAFIKEFKG